MVLLTKELSLFIKSAKAICKSESDGILIEGNTLTAFTNHYQIIYKHEDGISENNQMFLLPIKAFEYLLTFKIGTKFNFSFTHKSVTVSSNDSNSKSRFSLLSTDIAPMKSYDTNANDIEISTSALNMLRIVATAPVSKSVKSVAQGVSIVVKNGSLVAFGSDGCKLAYCKLQDNVTTDINIGIHKDFLSYILGNDLLSTEDTFHIASSKGNREVVFYNNVINIKCSQFDFSPFDIDYIFNNIDNDATIIEISRDKILSSINRVVLLTNTKSTAAAEMKVNASSSYVEISNLNGTSQLKDNISVNVIQASKTFSESEVSIGLNTNLLLTALSCVKSDVIKCIIGSNKFYYLQPCSENTNDLKYLVLPLKIHNT